MSGGVSSFWFASDDGTEGYTDACYQAYTETHYRCGKCGVYIPVGESTVRCRNGHKNSIIQMAGQIK